MTNSTAENATQIEAALNAARHAAAEARYNLRLAVKLIEEGENEAALKTVQLEAILGTVSLAHAAINQQSNSWASYAVARARN